MSADTNPARLTSDMIRQDFGHHEQTKKFLTILNNGGKINRPDNGDSGYDGNFDPDFETRSKAEFDVNHVLTEVERRAKTYFPVLNHATKATTYEEAIVNVNGTKIPYKYQINHFFVLPNGQRILYAQLRTDASDNNKVTPQGKKVRYALDLSVFPPNLTPGRSSDRYKIHFAITGQGSEYWAKLISTEYLRMHQAEIEKARAIQEKNKRAERYK